MENQILHNGYPNQDTKKVVKWQNNPRPTAIMAVAQLNWWHGSQLEICCWPSWENCYLMDFLLANSAKQSAYYTFGQKSIIAYRTKDKNLMTCFVIGILVKIKLNESKEMKKNFGYFHKSNILPSNSFLKAHRGDKA